MLVQASSEEEFLEKLQNLDWTKVIEQNTEGHRFDLTI